MGTPATTVSVVVCASPAEDRGDVRARPAHVEGQEVLVAAERARRRPRRRRRPRGPRGRSQRRRRWRRLSAVTPPEDCMIRGGGTPGLFDFAGQVLQVGGEPRRQVGVGGGRGEALVLPELGQDLAAQGDVHVGERLPAAPRRPASRAPGARRRRGGTRRRPRPRLLRRRRRRPSRLASSSGAISPSGPILSSTVKRSSRGTRAGGRSCGQVVEGGAVLARYLEHVPEALGRNEGRAGAPALEEGVRRDRHAVGEGDDGAGLDLRGLRWRSSRPPTGRRGVEGTFAVTSVPPPRGRRGR